MEISDRKAPGFWFYTADYERDMQILPLDAQGLWMRMLCWASENEMHRGFLEFSNGEPMTERDIASRVGKDLRVVQRCLAVMKRVGTFSVDDRGTIFCRRMARDSHISAVRKLAAQKRQLSVERAKTGEFAPAKPPAKAEQNPAVTVTVPVPVPDSLPILERVGVITDICASADARRNDAPPPPQNGTGKPPWFEEWWAIYWRKVSRKAAEKAFQTHVNSESAFRRVMDATKAQTVAMMAREPEHRPHAATWLNEERWNDEAPTPARANPPPKRASLVERTEALWAERIAKGEKPL